MLASDKRAHDSKNAEICALREKFAPLRELPGLDLGSLRAEARESRVRRQRAWARGIFVAILAAAASWAIASTKRPSQQQVSGTTSVDDVAIYDDKLLLMVESWEGRPLGRPETDSLNNGIATPPFVTNALASSGKQALLITASPAGNPKFLSPLTARDVRSGILVYEASVYLTDTGPGGVILGLVQDGAPSPDYVKGAVVFSNGFIRTSPTSQSLGRYESRRWYRVRVVMSLRDQVMSVTIDGRSAGEDLPMIGDATELRWEHPEWSEEQITGFTSFGVGGIYDGSVLEGKFAPLIVLSESDGRKTFRVDGTVAGWRPTGIVLRPGDCVRIEADPRQEIHYAGPGAPPRTNPDGFLLQADDPPSTRSLQSPRYEVPAPGAWFGALVARVGTMEGFCAGSDVTFMVSEEGELFLAYNDSTVSDNAGSFEVAVTVRGTRPDRRQ